MVCVESQGSEVRISDPERVQLIYGTKSKFAKTDFYPILKADAFATKHADQFTDLDESLHSVRRRLLSNVYSMSSVLESEAHVDVCTELFMARLSKFAANGQVLDLGMWLQMYAFDIIGELFFGQAFGFMETSNKRRDILTKLFELKAQKGDKDDFGIADIQQEGYVSLVAGSDTLHYGTALIPCWLTLLSKDVHWQEHLFVGDLQDDPANVAQVEAGIGVSRKAAQEERLVVPQARRVAYSVVD
ncbi:hypothetical protein CERZMDRAFT_97885 [Cercospora zeae-maydis SCOH1-5]|uniref:Cytochrome P450 n=1 Tax=Cercospora zeae-maydis SCOH1-5 TaxID=717836 RepID=A0A6A6FEU5_9PEZI|nr:hypothetical protein CERZMDRAFT_97885 [Cercospora zeae-maydis SCOH1-5]